MAIRKKRDRAAAQQPGRPAPQQPRPAQTYGYAEEMPFRGLERKWEKAWNRARSSPR